MRAADMPLRCQTAFGALLSAGARYADVTRLMLRLCLFFQRRAPLLIYGVRWLRCLVFAIMTYVADRRCRGVGRVMLPQRLMMLFDVCRRSLRRCLMPRFFRYEKN